MKRRIPKTVWILILIAIMILPPLRAANAAGFNYYTSIFVKKNPKKMEYNLDESFDKTGMQIYGNRVRADGKTDTCELGIDDLKFSPSKFTKAGTIKVTLTLKCMAASGNKEPFTTYLYVTVYDGDPPLYWTKKITAEATKTVYLVGDSFDQSSMTVWAYSEGDYPPEDAKWNCTKYVKSVSPTKFTKAGEQYVTVTAPLTGPHYTMDFTAKIKVKVYGKIEITKHPGGEVVEEGGACNFTVKAKHADKYAWYFIKGKTSVSAKDASSFFPGLKVSGGTEKKLKLSNIPIELDGWGVLCEFSNKAQTVRSDAAPITVYEKDEPAPTAHTTPEPSEEPTSDPEPKQGEATTAPSLPASAEATPAPSGSGHTHSFDGVYRHNSIEHWLECSCGARSGTASHVVTEWKTVSAPTKTVVGVRKGYCAVCGAEVLDSIPYVEGQDPGAEKDPTSWMLIAGLVLGGLAFLGCIGSFVIVLTKSKKQKQHR